MHNKIHYLAVIYLLNISRYKYIHLYIYYIYVYYPKCLKYASTKSDAWMIKLCIIKYII